MIYSIRNDKPLQNWLTEIVKRFITDLNQQLRNFKIYQNFYFSITKLFSENIQANYGIRKFLIL